MLRTWQIIVCSFILILVLLVFGILNAKNLRRKQKGDGAPHRTE